MIKAKLDSGLGLVRSVSWRGFGKIFSIFPSTFGSGGEFVHYVPETQTSRQEILNASNLHQNDFILLESHKLKIHKHMVYMVQIGGLKI